MRAGNVTVPSTSNAIRGTAARKTIPTIIQTKNIVLRCSSSVKAPDIDVVSMWIGSVARPQNKRTEKTATRMNPMLVN